jgi:hypothetical protein
MKDIHFKSVTANINFLVLPSHIYEGIYLDIPVEDIPGVEVVEARHNLAEYVAGQRLFYARVPDHQTKPPPQPTSSKA